MAKTDDEVPTTREAFRPVTSRGLLQSRNAGMLIPLTALSIPIIAILSDTDAIYFAGGIGVIAALTTASRHLLEVRHQQRMREIEASEQVAIAERNRLLAVDRLLDAEGVIDATQIPRTTR